MPGGAGRGATRLSRLAGALFVGPRGRETLAETAPQVDLRLYRHGWHGRAAGAEDQLTVA